jgi:hypothetical protein
VKTVLLTDPIAAAAGEMLRILRGERPRNLVNPEVLKKELT